MAHDGMGGGDPDGAGEIAGEGRQADAAFHGKRLPAGKCEINRIEDDRIAAAIAIVLRI